MMNSNCNSINPSRYLTLSLIIYAVLFIAVLAVSANTLPNKPQIINVVTEEYWPYSYIKDGKIVGSSTRTIHKILEHANILYQINIYPWARAYQKALKNKNTLIYTIYRTPERENKFHWIGKIFNGDQIYFYTRANSNITANSIADLVNYRFITQKYSSSSQFVNTHKFINTRFVASFKQCVGMLLKGRGDLIMASPKYLAEQLQLLNLPQNSVKIVLPAVVYSGFIGLSLGSDPQLLTKLTIAYAELIAKGDITINQ
ncbi:MAG: transporter substrate-binding domain-containing protein [Gammaproteobacteria bacterium]|nr:transporter substrate-binding domain-containing protein [Gammaproteobacteria bacterium]